MIVRVHPEILRGQGLPEELLDEKSIWRDRYRSIVELEKHLTRNGTKILKFFLHISKDEQEKRFRERIDKPDKNWKLSLADIQERDFWKDYQKAYGECLGATSTKQSPWFVVPADDKKNARLVISEAIIETMKGLHMSYPKMDKARLKELKSIRKLL